VKGQGMTMAQSTVDMAASCTKSLEDLESFSGEMMAQSRLYDHHWERYTSVKSLRAMTIQTSFYVK